MLKETEFGDALKLFSEPLLDLGVKHAFFGKPLDGKALLRREEGLSPFLSAHGLKSLTYLDQHHTDTVLVAAPLDSPGVLRIGRGDALIVPREHLTPERGFCLLTADCLSIIVSSVEAVALIHAGWRGLTEGIVQKAVRHLEAPTLAAIGPAAGIGRYEVGQEVIDSFRDLTPVTAQRGEAWYLDLAGTAKEILFQEGITEVASSGTCTIEDQSWFSHRREPAEPGRNLTLVYGSAE